MKEFLYHYDGATHKGKIVIKSNGSDEHYLVDKIICAVKTVTERQDTTPKFYVTGFCTDIVFTRQDNQLTVYIA